MLLNKLAAAVGGAAVDYEPFVVGECLADNALVCLLQSLKVLRLTVMMDSFMMRLCCVKN